MTPTTCTTPECRNPININYARKGRPLCTDCGREQYELRHRAAMKASDQRRREMRRPPCDQCGKPQSGYKFRKGGHFCKSCGPAVKRARRAEIERERTQAKKKPAEARPAPYKAAGSGVRFLAPKSNASAIDRAVMNAYERAEMRGDQYEMAQIRHAPENAHLFR